MRAELELNYLTGSQYSKQKKEIGVKATLKMLVKLTQGLRLFCVNPELVLPKWIH
jgi:hypothetical protein